MEHDPINPQKRMGPDIEESSPPRKRRKIPDAPTLALNERSTSNTNLTIVASPLPVEQHEEIQNVTSGQFVSNSDQVLGEEDLQTLTHFIGRSSVVKWDSQYVAKIFYKRVELHLGNYNSRTEGEEAVAYHVERPYLLEEKLQEMQNHRYKRTDLLKQRRSEHPIASGMFVNPSHTPSRKKKNTRRSGKREAESSGMLVKQDPQLPGDASIEPGTIVDSKSKKVVSGIFLKKYPRKSSIDENLIPTLLGTLPPAYQQYRAMFTDEGFDDMDVWDLLLKCNSCFEVQSKLNGLKNGFHAEVIAEKMRQVPFFI